MVVVTGSKGLVGSQAVKFFLDKGYEVVGIDNNMREDFFGKDGSVAWNVIDHPKYTHYDKDIRDCYGVIYTHKPELIIHAAAQPSHDWATNHARVDFSINATATLELLEAYRECCPKGVFIYVSTNKVYGDVPNKLEYSDCPTRFEPLWDEFRIGFSETTSVDNCLHSLFGVSKLSADLMVQEYGKYFGLNTGVFRCGCITGAGHSGAEMHGFLAYMAKCKRENRVYVVYGYNGKQVRDNIHAYDLVNAFYHYFKNPKQGEVYNMGGGRYSNISVREALKAFGIENWQYVIEPRKGDHKWYISDVRKFRQDYPEWEYTYNIDDIINELQEVK